MRTLGNVLWFLLCGLWQGLAWTFIGLIWCVTVIGIPVGLQCFKMASLSFFPFGKTVNYGGGVGSVLLNIVWILIFGLPMAIAIAAEGLALCVTIIGIPFGVQCFKQAKLALMPFGATIN